MYNSKAVCYFCFNAFGAKSFHDRYELLEWPPKTTAFWNAFYFQRYAGESKPNGQRVGIDKSNDNDG